MPVAASPDPEEAEGEASSEALPLLDRDPRQNSEISGFASL